MNFVDVTPVSNLTERTPQQSTQFADCLTLHVD